MDKQIERTGDDNKNNIGVLYGIGVGPGDPELMTLKAINRIKACDIIAIPAVSREECYAYSIVQAVLPEIEKKQIMCTPFPMIKDKEKLAISHNKIYSDIVCELLAGKNVAMLTIGDPSVYSTYMYIHKRVIQAGFTAVMISGVPSFCAAAARLGISLGEMRDEIHIIPASYDVRDTMGYGGTCVYMKSGKKLAELIEVLRTAAINVPSLVPTTVKLKNSSESTTANTPQPMSKATLIKPKSLFIVSETAFTKASPEFIITLAITERAIPKPSTIVPATTITNCIG